MLSEHVQHDSPVTLAARPCCLQALQYLALCPTHGADAAEVLLESLPVGVTRLLQLLLSAMQL
jgi:hypothetical protein